MWVVYAIVNMYPPAVIAAMACVGAAYYWHKWM